MSIERVREALKKAGMEDRILEFDESSATVELAAKAVDCEPARIVKTLSFHAGDRIVLIACAGDARIDNRKFKDLFAAKPKMLKAEEAEMLIGHAVGGVCPFGVNPKAEIFLDESILRFDEVYPAAGSSNSAVRLSPEELARCAAPCIWADLCKLPEEHPFPRE